MRVVGFLLGLLVADAASACPGDPGEGLRAPAAADVVAHLAGGGRVEVSGFVEAWPPPVPRAVRRLACGGTVAGAPFRVWVDGRGVKVVIDGGDEVTPRWHRAVVPRAWARSLLGALGGAVVRPAVLPDDVEADLGARCATGATEIGIGGDRLVVLDGPTASDRRLPGAPSVCAAWLEHGHDAFVARHLEVALLPARDRPPG